MESSYKFLFDLALILLSTKVLGLITRRFKMPQVVGALLAGLIFGPAVFNIITETEYIKMTAEIGVIVLMFSAGMETDVRELKRSGKAALIIATLGVIVPLAGGFAVAWFFNREGMIAPDSSLSVGPLLQNIFIGVILTATSVSITVETLKELGKLRTRSGSAILGAAVIDDILGIIALTIITSLADSSVNIWVVLLKIVGFFAFAILAGYLFYKFFTSWTNDKFDMQRHVIISFVFCLLLSFVAEHFFGVADITGAYIAGLIISMTAKERYIEARFNTLSYLYLSPMFFASIGLNVKLDNMSGMVILFAVVLTIVAILSKIIGCGLGAKLCKYENYQAVRIGVGMVSRGEVALIVANKGKELGMMSDTLMGPIVIVVIITTIVAPILLKPIYKKDPKDPALLAAEDIVED